MATEESSKWQQSKWEGKACAELKRSTAGQVWPLVEDFFNHHKWFPVLTTIQPLEGVSGQPGCIRYCTSTITTSHASSESEKTTKAIWAKERLLTVDPVERCISYEVSENNMGINSYIATWKVLELSQAAAATANEGCQIEWSFVADPMDGFTFEGFLSFIQIYLQGIAQSMEDALCTTPATSL